MVKVSQQLAPSQTPVFRIRIQRYRKLHLCCFRKGKTNKKKNGFKVKQTQENGCLWLSSPDLYPLHDKSLLHSFIHPGFGLTLAGFSRGSADRLSSSGRRCTTGPCAPLRTLCGISWPPRGPSCPRKTARRCNKRGGTGEKNK